jgi:hypothetical protein
MGTVPIAGLQWGGFRVPVSGLCGVSIATAFIGTVTIASDGCAAKGIGTENSTFSLIVSAETVTLTARFHVDAFSLSDNSNTRGVA